MSRVRYKSISLIKYSFIKSIKKMLWLWSPRMVGIPSELLSTKDQLKLCWGFLTLGCVSIEAEWSPALVRNRNSWKKYLNVTYQPIPQLQWCHHQSHRPDSVLIAPAVFRSHAPHPSSSGWWLHRWWLSHLRRDWPWACQAHVARVKCGEWTQFGEQPRCATEMEFMFLLSELMLISFKKS